MSSGPDDPASLPPAAPSPSTATSSSEVVAAESGVVPPPTVLTESPTPSVKIAAPGQTAASGPSPLVPIERVIANRERIEREFLDVRRICVFYGCLLLPILILVGWAHHNKDADRFLAELILGSVMYGAVCVFAFQWREELRARFAWPRNQPISIWLLIAATPAFTVLCVSLFFGALKKAGLPVEPAFTPELLANTPLPAIYFWTAVCPAIFEEIAFRGIILSKLKRLTSSTQAIWVTTLLFGILHFDIIAMAVFLIPLAWVAGWLTHRTGSLWPAMIIHFLHNAGILTLARFF